MRYVRSLCRSATFYATAVLGAAYATGHDGTWKTTALCFAIGVCSALGWRADDE